MLNKFIINRSEGDKMFSVNEYVVYGSEGVCMVESIGHPAISGLDPAKEYYTLCPVSRVGRIYTPVDSTIKMRKALTAEQAQKIIDTIDNVSSSLDVPKDSKQAMMYYKQLIGTYDCLNLISIIKYVFLKQKEFLLAKKNVPAIDMRYLKIAEDMLYGEFGFALGMEPKNVRDYITKCCEGQTA